MKMKLYIMTVFIVLLPTWIFALPKALVFYVPSGHSSIDAIAMETRNRLRTKITEYGRFELIEENQILGAKTTYFSENQEQTKTINPLVEAQQIASRTNADLICLISIYQQGVTSYGELHVIPVSNDLTKFKKRTVCKTKIMKNIPVLLEREIITMHKEMPVSFSVLKKTGNKALIDAGTYSGLETGKEYTLTNGSKIQVVTAGRYQSFVTYNGTIPSKAQIAKHPKTGFHSSQNRDEQSQNIFRKYGASYTYHKGGDPEKRYIESLLVINPFGNVLIPGFGGFLTTHYMGFEEADRSFENIGATATIYLYQLFYIPAKNGFGVHFFPWIDKDKSDADARMHKFLWATIPVTFTVSYLDHLAIQYNKDRVLPPGFENQSNTVLHTLIVPGGGFFYKGHRIQGWSYFATESLIAYYAVDNWGKTESRNALILLGAVKAGELVHTLLTPSSYTFYNEELLDKETTSYSFFLNQDQEERTSYMAAATLHY